MNSARLVHSVARRGVAAVFMAAALAACDAPRFDDERARALALQLDDQIEVAESTTLYVLFALLNAAGYDDESHSEVHPVRRSVRGALPRLLDDDVFAVAEQWYETHARNASLADIASVALATDGPPNFTPDPAWLAGPAQREPYRDLAGLPALLRRFTAALPMDSLYVEHRPAHGTYIGAYGAAARRDLFEVLRYARVRDLAELSLAAGGLPMVAFPTLLLSHNTGFSVTHRDTLFTVVGPQQTVRHNPHRFIHGVTAPFGLTETVDESLVRAVGHRLQALRDPAAPIAQRAAADSQAGYPLVPGFVRALERYERQSLPLREYHPQFSAQAAR